MTIMRVRQSHSFRSHSSSIKSGRSTVYTKSLRVILAISLVTLLSSNPSNFSLVPAVTAQGLDEFTDPFEDEVATPTDETTDRTPDRTPDPTPDPTPTDDPDPEPTEEPTEEPTPTETRSTTTITTRRTVTPTEEPTEEPETVDAPEPTEDSDQTDFINPGDANANAAPASDEGEGTSAADIVKWVVIGLGCAAGLLLAVWLFRKWKLRPSKQFKTKFDPAAAFSMGGTDFEHTYMRR